MQCASCRAENQAGSGFCDQCGTALPAQCAACGAALRLEARFCNACGARVGGEAPAAAGPASGPNAMHAPAPAVAPARYTPRHLAEKILKSPSDLEGEQGHG